MLTASLSEDLACSLGDTTGVPRSRRAFARSTTHNTHKRQPKCDSSLAASSRPQRQCMPSPPAPCRPDRTRNDCGRDKNRPRGRTLRPDANPRPLLWAAGPVAKTRPPSVYAARCRTQRCHQRSRQPGVDALRYELHPHDRVIGAVPHPRPAPTPQARLRLEHYPNHPAQPGAHCHRSPWERPDSSVLNPNRSGAAPGNGSSCPRTRTLRLTDIVHLRVDPISYCSSMSTWDSQQFVSHGRSHCKSCPRSRSNTTVLRQTRKARLHEQR
jgi:hypothetical protein